MVCVDHTPFFNDKTQVFNDEMPICNDKTLVFKRRHGVFFNAAPGPCNCMDGNARQADWSSARYMADLDRDLKALVAVPFNIATYRRLGQLRATLRVLDW